VYFNAQRHQRQERVQVNCFQLLLGNSLNSLLAENLLHSHWFLIKIFSSKLNIRSIIHLTVNIHDVQCDAVMTSLPMRNH